MERRGTGEKRAGRGKKIRGGVMEIGKSDRMKERRGKYTKRRGGNCGVEIGKPGEKKRREKKIQGGGMQKRKNRAERRAKRIQRKGGNGEAWSERGGRKYKEAGWDGSGCQHCKRRCTHPRRREWERGNRE